MGRVINIASKLDREPRFLVVDEEHRYKVDCRKNTIIQFLALSDQYDENDSKESVEMMDSGLKMLLGDKPFKEIEAMELPFDSYQWVFKAAVAVALNKDLEEVEADFRAEEGKQ